MNKFAVIVAGGSGARMGSPLPKQFLPVLGKPVLWHTINTFLRSFDDLQIILVLPKEHIALSVSIVSPVHVNRVTIVEGGRTRFHSVFNGLRHVSEDSVVFVHDGVRCLLTTDLIHRCYEATLSKGNAVPAIKAVDSLRIATSRGNKILDRDHVWAIQTPQTFKSELILTAFQQEYDESFTDEATVVERMGVKINLIEGESHNIKITKPVDILVAENYLNSLSGQGSRL